MGSHSFFRCQPSRPARPCFFNLCQVHLYVCWAPLHLHPSSERPWRTLVIFFKSVSCRFVAASSTRVLNRFSRCSDSRQSLLQCDPTCCLLSRHNRGAEPRLRAASRCNYFGVPKKTAARGSPLAAIGVDYNRSCSLPKPSNRISDY
jgi:hypothetical protein